MKDQFLPYEQSLILKELGFKSDCFAHYGSNGILHYEYAEFDDGNVDSSPYKCLAPLLYQVIDWLAKEYEIEINLYRVPILSFSDTDIKISYCITIKDFKKYYWSNPIFINHGINDRPINHWYDKNLAYLKAIEEALKIIIK